MDAAKEETQARITCERVGMSQMNVKHLETREIVENSAMLHSTAEELSIGRDRVQIGWERGAMEMTTEGEVGAKLGAQVGVRAFAECKVTRTTYLTKQGCEQRQKKEISC